MEPPATENPKTHAEANPAAEGHRLQPGDGRGAADPLRRRPRRLGLDPAAQAAGAAWGRGERRRRRGRRSRRACSPRPRAPGWTPPDDLVGLIDRPAGGALLSTGSGLARRAGVLSVGFESVLQSAAGSGKAAWLIEASTGPPTGGANCSRRDAGQPCGRRLCGAFNSDEVSLALGTRECDTRRPPCGAMGRALNRRGRAAGRVSSFRRVGARKPKRAGRVSALAVLLAWCGFYCGGVETGPVQSHLASRVRFYGFE